MQTTLTFSLVIKFHLIHCVVLPCLYDSENHYGIF